MLVSQGATFSSTVDIAGALGVTGNADIYGPFEAHDTLTVDNQSTFNDNVTISAGNLLLSTGTATLSSGSLFLTVGSIEMSNGDINISGLHDVKVNGVGLQEQIAYLYNYLFSQSYPSICALASAPEGGRTFDQNGDNSASRSYTVQSTETIIL